jgi:hypothetical protein
MIPLHNVTREPVIVELVQENDTARRKEWAHITLSQEKYLVQYQDGTKNFCCWMKVVSRNLNKCFFGFCKNPGNSKNVQDQKTRV